MPDPVVFAATGCPSCGGRAELEEEDGTRKWACFSCGYEFGFLQLEQADSCSLGVPESVRREFQDVMDYQDRQLRPAVLFPPVIPVGRPE